MTSPTKILRYSDLVARGYVRNRTTLYRWIKQGIFPAGFMLGPNQRVWTEKQIEDDVAEKIAQSRRPAA